MPAPKIRADYARLRDISRVFGRQADATARALQALQVQLDGLQSGDWQGQGAIAFYAEMNDALLPSVRRLQSALQTAAALTQQISQQMKTAEDEAARVLRGDGAGNLTVAGRAAGAANAGPAHPGGVAAPPTGPAPAGAGAYAPLPPYRPDLRKSKLSDDERKARGAEVMKLLAAGQKDKAIQAAVQLYHLDLSAVNGVPTYSRFVHGDGATWADGRVFIGDHALPGQGDSPGSLASTIGHESIHARQLQEGRWTNPPEVDENNLVEVSKRMNDLSTDEADKQAGAMNEIEAYDWELQNAAENDLTEADVIDLERHRKIYYNMLSPANQAQIRQHSYSPFKAQIF